MPPAKSMNRLQAPIWEYQPHGESIHEYDLFRMYLELGPNRTARIVAKRQGRETRSYMSYLQKLSVDNRWTERCRAHDSHISHLESEARVKAEVEARLRRKKMRAAAGRAFQENAIGIISAAKLLEKDRNGNLKLTVAEARSLIRYVMPLYQYGMNLEDVVDREVQELDAEVAARAIDNSTKEVTGRDTGDVLGVLGELNRILATQGLPSIEEAEELAALEYRPGDEVDDLPLDDPDELALEDEGLFDDDEK